MMVSSPDRGSMRVLTRRHRLVRLAAALAFAFSGGVLVAACGGIEHGPAAAPARAIAGSPAPSYLEHPPDFALEDQAGRRVRLSGLHSKVVLVTFLYTHCPDVCPLIAEALNRALRSLGPGREHVRVLAVSVDPTGDVPAAVRSFIKRHRLLPQFRYLVGSRRELERVWAEYKVAANPASLDTVDHSAFTLLVDRNGVGRLIYGSDVRSSDVLHDLRRIGATGQDA